MRISQISFGAKYKTVGKKAPDAIMAEYNNKISQLAQNANIALSAQYTMQLPKIQIRLSELPQDSFVRLHSTPQEDGYDADIADFVPYLDFVPEDEEDIDLMQKEISTGANILELGLNNSGAFDEKRIVNWIDKIIDFYSK